MKPRERGAFRRFGLKALFFILVPLGMTACGVPVVSQAAPAGLLMFYARPVSGTRETLWVRPYSASGKPRAKPVNLGQLGLVAEAGIVSVSGPKVYVTLGHSLVVLQHGRVVARWAVPVGDSLLSVRVLHQRVYGVMENLNGSRVNIDMWRHRRWRTVASKIPLGITTLEAGLGGAPWALVSDPRRAWLISLEWSERIQVDHVPQGTVGFSGRRGLVPFTSGASGFDMAEVNLSHGSLRTLRFRSVNHAILVMADTIPSWGTSVKGMVPYRRGHFLWSKLVPWPGTLATTPVLVGRGAPWILVLDGPSQGYWFNVDSGTFGPRFQMNAPWRAVVRAISLTS